MNVGNNGARSRQKLLRSERWQEVSGSECHDPWSILVGFANPRLKDRFLGSANKTQRITRDKTTIELDDTAMSEIKAKDAKGHFQDSNRKISNSQRKN